MNKVYGLATGQGEVELFAEEKDKFYLNAVAADILFKRNADDTIDSLVLIQGGQEMPGKKTE